MRLSWVRFHVVVFKQFEQSKMIRNNLNNGCSSDISARIFSPLAYGVHCVKSVQIRSYFWSVFSRIWTEYGEKVVVKENTLCYLYSH